MKKIINLLLTLIVSTSYAAVEDVFWFGGTGDWMTQSNWTEDITDGSKWAIPGWVVGNPYNDGSWTSTSNKGFARIVSGTAKITSLSNPDGRIERFYVGGPSGANLEISTNLSVYRGWMGPNAGDTGTITQTAGAVTISGGTDYFGDNGTGIYNLNGGTFTVGGTIYFGTNGGSSGTINVNAGTFTTNSYTSFGSGTNVLGINTFGTLNISNNGSYVNNYEFVAGGNGSALGTINVSGNGSFTQTSTTKSFYLGNYGSGTFTQTGGTTSINTVNAYIGRYGDFSGVGTLNLSGGTFSITASTSTIDTGNGIFLGRTGNGFVNQTGGTLNLTAANSQICVGYYRTGTTNFKNGAMDAKQYVIGYSNPNTVATLNMNGGSLSATGNMYLGYYWGTTGTTDTATTGNLNLSGGTVNVTGSVYDGRSGNGHITVSGGSLTANAMFMSLYYDATTQPQASSLTISGGSFIIANQLSTYSAKDVITVSGSDATKISVGHLVMRNSATLAVELDAGGVTPIEVGDTTGQVDIQKITFKVSTLPDYVGGIGTTYDVMKTTTGKIDISGATLVQETGAKHTFSYAVVDDGNGGQILRLTEIQGTCGDSLHPIVDADLNGDCVVDYRDLRELAQGWLNCSFNCP